jgi:hypothetical protein
MLARRAPKRNGQRNFHAQGHLSFVTHGLRGGLYRFAHAEPMISRRERAGGGTGLAGCGPGPKAAGPDGGPRTRDGGRRAGMEGGGAGWRAADPGWRVTGSGWRAADLGSEGGLGSGLGAGGSNLDS